jgi:hypothetical protein
MANTVDSASDSRTANNAVRHQYRVLSDPEKLAMVAIKDYGLTCPASATSSTPTASTN